MGYAPVDFTEWRRSRRAAAFQQALGVCEGTGRPNGGDQAAAISLTGRCSQHHSECGGGPIFEPLITSGKVDELADQKQIAGLKAGLEIPAKDYLKAMRIRRIMKEEIGKIFGELDLLLAPSRLGPAPKISEPLDRLQLGQPVPQPRPACGP